VFVPNEVVAAKIEVILSPTQFCSGQTSPVCREQNFVSQKPILFVTDAILFVSNAITSPETQF
jgi:hypothetical protein